MRKAPDLRRFAELAVARKGFAFVASMKSAYEEDAGPSPLAELAVARNSFALVASMKCAYEEDAGPAPFCR